MNYKGDPYWTIARFDSKAAKKGERIFYYPKTKTVLKGAAAEKAAAEFERCKEMEDFYAPNDPVQYNEWLNNQ